MTGTYITHLAVHAVQQQALVRKLLGLSDTQQYGSASRGVYICLDADNKAALITSMQ